MSARGLSLHLLVARVRSELVDVAVGRCGLGAGGCFSEKGPGVRLPRALRHARSS